VAAAITGVVAAAAGGDGLGKVADAVGGGVEVEVEVEDEVVDPQATSQAGASSRVARVVIDRIFMVTYPVARGLSASQGVPGRVTSILGPQGVESRYLQSDEKYTFLTSV
jgi:hypothetical protein